MAKVVKKKLQKPKGFREGSIPLAKENYMIMGVGIAVIVVAYLAMWLDGSIEGFLPLVVSPILLVAGYCVIIPAGLLYKKTPSVSNEPDSAQ